MGTDLHGTAGQAYGFFYCSAPKATVEAELPKARLHSNAPSELELTLIEGMANVKGDSRLLALATEAGKSGDNYLLRASLPGGTNVDAAKHLSAILNMLWGSDLYKSADEFSSDIAYLENGKYVVWP